VLAGWAFDVPALKSIWPALATMKVNTALAFVLSGAALAAPRGAALFGLAAALLSAMTLAQDLFGFDLGIDQALVRDDDVEHGAAAGRMSPATAICFMLAGVAAALIAKPGREEAGQWLALGLLVMAIVALVGYTYDVQHLYKVWAYASMAAHTALGFFVLAIGLLAARRNLGWVRRFGSAGPGGRMLRQVLVPALIGLFAIGWLRVRAEEGGLFDIGFGTAVMVISGGLLFTWLAWRFARELDLAAQVLEQMAARRRRHEALIEGQQRCLELIATGAPLARTHEELAHTVEAQVPGMLCSILLLDNGGRVRHSAAPSMPLSFVRAIDGRTIGAAAGSCGTAAYRREAVVVQDIASDPLWADYREYALPHGLRACWSTPVFDDEGRVVATFALYYRDPRRPEPEHVELIQLATQTVAISVQRHRAEATLRDSESRLRNLARRLLQVEEYERRALSRELHDRVGQNLSAINLNLQLIREQLARGPTERVAARLEDAQRLLSETTGDVRDLMVELRPPGLDDYGLATALRNYVERTAERFSGEISVTGDLQPRLPVDTELALFRIAQEALSNAAKHSRADNVEIQLERDGRRARMTVVDDGVGFAPDTVENASWGLATMRERAEAVRARLLIESRPGEGVRITAELAA
jgi:signal transduction histidine kinase